MASSLLTGGNVSVTNGDKELVIKIAPENRQTVDTLVKLELEGSAIEIEAIEIEAIEIEAIEIEAKGEVKSKKKMSVPMSW